jgi:hypothetical protein
MPFDNEQAAYGTQTRSSSQGQEYRWVSGQTLLHYEAGRQGAAESHDGTHREIDAACQDSEGHADGSDSDDGGLKGDIQQIRDLQEALREQR